jgi:hypothetical protein
VQAAAASLGLTAGSVQFVPEPAAAALAAGGLAELLRAARPRRAA